MTHLDLSTLDTSAASDEGAVMELQHPTTNAVLALPDGTPVSITLAGQDSETYRKADRKITNKRLATTRSGRPATLTAESLESDNLARLVACTIAWNGIGLGGQALDCTPENARKVYTTMPWIREQAEGFTADRANFLKTP